MRKNNKITFIGFNRQNIIIFVMQSLNLFCEVLNSYMLKDHAGILQYLWNMFTELSLVQMNWFVSSGTCYPKTFSYIYSVQVERQNVDKFITQTHNN